MTNFLTKSRDRRPKSLSSWSGEVFVSKVTVTLTFELLTSKSKGSCTCDDKHLYWIRGQLVKSLSCYWSDILLFKDSVYLTFNLLILKFSYSKRIVSKHLSRYKIQCLKYYLNHKRFLRIRYCKRNKAKRVRSVPIVLLLLSDNTITGLLQWLLCYT
jgi:hypothetical protein